ncbi:MAG: potassium channel family protein [Methanobrevibacter sp.]|jgi:voltage-gated potassium channel|nr:potassium channel family protein [Methanobrevibacter sp.]
MYLNKKISFNLVIGILLTLDIIFLLNQIFNELPVKFTILLAFFDISVCAILWISFILEYKQAKNKKRFLKHDWYYIIALIPDSFLYFFGISFASGFIRLILLLRLVRVIILLKRESKFLSDFLSETHLDKLILIIAIFALASSLALFMFDNSITSFWEALWYVLVTLSTVGYGDVIPKSFIGRVIGFILLFIGVLLFGVLTGSISYFYSKKIELKTKKDVTKRINNLENKVNEIHAIVTEIKKNK